MASPQSAIQRVELGSTYEEFNLAMSRNGFIGHRVLVPRFVQQQSSKVPQIPLNQLLLNVDPTSGEQSDSERGNWEFTNYTFATIAKKWEEVVHDRLSAIYRDLFEMETISANRAEDFLLRKFERECATAAFDTAVYTTTQAATATFSTKATATPVADILTLLKTVEDNCGQTPNVVYMDRSLYREAKETDEVVDRLKYSGIDDPKRIGPAALAALFDVDEVVIAGKLQTGFSGVVVENTANEAAAASLSRIWDTTKVGVARVATGPDPQETCLGRSLLWSRWNASLGPGGALAVMMDQYREESHEADIFRARADWDIISLTTACCGILTGA